MQGELTGEQELEIYLHAMREEAKAEKELADREADERDDKRPAE